MKIKNKDFIVIDIVMATYNGEKYIKEQLDSILKQTYKDFKVIISDDGSSDNTINIIKSYVTENNNFKLVRNSKNHGFIGNFNNALQYSNSDYVAFCDQDDIWTKNHLELLLNNIGANDLIGGNAELIDENGNSLQFTMKDVLGIRKIPKNQNKIPFSLLYNNIFQGTACLITKSLKEKLLVSQSENAFHDYWAALLASVNNGVKYLDEVVLFYRQHNSTVTTNEKNTITYKLNNIRIPEEKYLKQIKVLQDFSKIEESKCINKNIMDAILFYENKMNNKNIRNLFFVIHNYSKIYPFSKNNVLLFLARFFKILFNLS